MDSAEVGREEVGRAEVSRAEVGRAEVDRAEVGRAQVDMDRGGTENSKQIFPEMKLCCLRPNSYIHVSVWDLYIPTIGSAFSAFSAGK